MNLMTQPLFRTFVKNYSLFITSKHFSGVKADSKIPINSILSMDCHVHIIHKNMIQQKQLKVQSQKATSLAVTFLEYWKRKNASLAHHWDCMGFQVSRYHGIIWDIMRLYGTTDAFFNVQTHFLSG